MKTHAVSRDIDAPPAAVWRALVELERYPEWNRTITRAAGELAAGARLALSLDLGTERRPFDPAVVEVRPERVLLLEKVLGGAWLLRAEHAFRLEPLPGGGTRLTQDWRLSGLLAPVVWPKFRAGLPAFARMSDDLAAEAERRCAGA